MTFFVVNNQDEVVGSFPTRENAVNFVCKSMINTKIQNIIEGKEILIKYSC